MTDDACAICGSHGLQPDRATDYITDTPFTVRRCTKCGFGRTEPLPPSMDAFYPAGYRQYSGLTLAMLRLLYAWRVKGWSRRLGRPGRALEIGCGDGWMLAALRDRGWSVLGNERSLAGARSAAAINHVSTFVGSVDALRPATRFDLVILFQVLEHLAEPLSTLRHGAALLEPGGTMVVAVPNFASWQSRAFGPSWFHLDVPRHVSHFSPTALRLAVEQMGLRVVRTGFASPEHDPYGWVQSALNRLGFEQNLLTKWLMGIVKPAPTTLAVMVAISALLFVPSLLLAAWSWLAGSGAVMEMWAVKT